MDDTKMDFIIGKIREISTTATDDDLNLQLNLELSGALSEMLHAYLAATLRFDALIMFLLDLRERLDDKHLDLELAFGTLIDHVWLADASRMDETPPADIDQLAQLVEQMFLGNLVSLKLLKERLDSELLQKAHIIQDKKAWNRRIVRTNTQIMYKQQKFNLIQEESEGYAKLVVEVQSRAELFAKSKSLDMGIVNGTMDAILSLIGYFNLDPNHAVEVVLGLFISNVQSDFQFYLELFKVSPWHNTTNIDKPIFANLLGYRLSQLNDLCSDGARPKIIMCAALMLKKGFFSVSDIYGYLKPADDAFQELHADAVLNFKESAKTYGRVALSALPSDSAAPVSVKSESIGNQKTQLCEALFYVGDFLNGKKLLMHNADVFLTLQPTIVKSLSRCLHWAIDPVYSSAFTTSHAIPFTCEVDAFLEYFQTWSDGQTQVRNYKEFFQDLVPMLYLVAPYLHQDPALLTKLCCLTHKNIDVNDPTSKTSRMWIKILTAVILPGVSMSGTNYGLSWEVWNVIKSLPYDLRFTIYGEWKNTLYSSFPELQLPYAQAVVETKKILRRISKENVKQFGRSLGKISHMNPVAVFSTILDQLQAYENLIVPVVDCLRYVSEMGHDILVYTLIQACASTEKDRLKTDGTNLSLWINSLAVFAGHLFKKYLTIELTSLLDYIHCQVLSGNPLDLVILKELVTRMSGIEQVLEGSSPHQIESKAGGKALHLAVRNYGVVSKVALNTKSSAPHLLNSLVNTDSVVKFAVLVGKQRHACVYTSHEEHLKALGSLFDQVHETFLHYMEFWISNMDADKIAQCVPTFDELHGRFSLEPDIAWSILRPKMSAEYSKLLSLGADSLNSDAMEVEQTKCSLSQILDLNDVTSLPINFWTAMQPSFYTEFWTLSLRDIFVPTSAYSIELEKLKLSLTSIDSNPVTGTRNDSHTLIDKRQTSRDKIVQSIDELKLEMHNQTKHVEAVRKDLKQLKSTWFLDGVDRNSIISSVLQNCVRPRLGFSGEDAMYCAKFLLLLHDLGTPNFNTLRALDIIFNDISVSIFTCSHNEAMQMAGFLFYLLETVHEWHGSETKYSVAAVGAGCVGFRRRWPTNSSVGALSSTDIPAEDLLSFEDYRHIVHKWHLRFNKAFVASLESGEYMRMRNSIVILDRITDFFPRISDIGLQMKKKLKVLIENEKREDVKVLLNRYDAALQKNSSRWVPTEDFHFVAPKPIDLSEKSAEEPVSNDTGNLGPKRDTQEISKSDEVKSPVRRTTTSSSARSQPTPIRVPTDSPMHRPLNSDSRPLVSRNRPDSTRRQEHSDTRRSTSDRNDPPRRDANPRENTRYDGTRSNDAVIRRNSPPSVMVEKAPPIVSQKTVAVEEKVDTSNRSRELLELRDRAVRSAQKSEDRQKNAVKDTKHDKSSGSELKATDVPFVPQKDSQILPAPERSVQSRRGGDKDDRKTADFSPSRTDLKRRGPDEPGIRISLSGSDKVEESVDEDAKRRKTVTATQSSSNAGRSNDTGNSYNRRSTDTDRVDGSYFRLNRNAAGAIDSALHQSLPTRSNVASRPSGNTNISSATQRGSRPETRRMDSDDRGQNERQPERGARRPYSKRRN